MRESKNSVLELLFGIAIFAFSIWGIYSLYHHGEVVAYEMYCSGEIKNGSCSGKIDALGVTTYKVSGDAQFVIGKPDHLSPFKLTHCSVWDVKNWACSEESAFGTYEFKMVDGDYYNNLTLKNGQTVSGLPENFYYGSAFEWWTHRSKSQ